MTQNNTPTKIVAHRGDTKDYPENTLSAFKSALEKGADAIELDVHFTNDGRLVVHHDYYLGNPDNGKGVIHEKDLAYIQSLKINNNERIPTLEEVFQLIGDRLKYEIELKGFTEAFLVEMIATVKKYHLESRVEFTSPHSYDLTRLKSLGPSLKTGAFIPVSPSWMDKRLSQTFAIHNALLGGIDVLHCPLDMIDEEFIQVAHSKNLLVHAADCDTEAILRTALKMQVDQLSTNNLELALALDN